MTPSPSTTIGCRNPNAWMDRAAVIAFYLGTLPNLGWRAKADALFQREGEVLRLGFMGDDGALVVRFTLQPE